MSATQFTLGSSVPSGAGLVAYQIKDRTGTQSNIVVQDNATTLHPTQTGQAPWTIGYQILDPRNSSALVTGDRQTVSDPSARIGVAFVMSVDATEAPAGLSGTDAGSGDWTRIGDLPEAGAVCSPVDDPPATKSLSFAMQAQAHTQWCWAAVSSSVADYYTPHDPPDPSQCALASWAFSPNDCCASGGSHACNRPYLVSTALRHVGHLRSSFSGTMTFADIQREIVADRPIAIGIEWDDGSGHAVAFTGYATIDGTRYVRVQDPGSGSSTSWVRLSGFPAGGVWDWCYTTQA